MTAARALLGALAMVLAACGTVDSRDAADTRPGPAVTGATAAGAALPTTEQPCGRVPSPPARYSKVLWVMFENQSYEDLIGVVGSAQEQRAPYLNWLSRRCGLATASYGITHPSLPNYLGLVSGTTGGIVATCTPAACPQTAPTLFAQVRASGRQWKVYAESMTSNCQKTDTSLYAARHTGAPYYPAIAADCARNQVPMGSTTSGALVSDLARRRRAGVLDGGAEHVQHPARLPDKHGRQVAAKADAQDPCRARLPLRQHAGPAVL
jgi:hypothetical protein